MASYKEQDSRHKKQGIYFTGINPESSERNFGLAFKISIKGNEKFIRGDEFLLGPDSPDSSCLGFVVDPEAVMAVRTGMYLTATNAEFQVTDKIWSADARGRGGIFLKLKPLADISCEQFLDLTLSRQGFSLAWITMSDKGSKGHRLDESGPLIERICASSLDISLSRGFVIPDDYGQLQSLLVQLCLTSGFDLVITTGGTGLSPRDITPEVTMGLIEKRLPGFEQAMVNYSLTKTPHAMISRAVAGTLGQSMIINLPGSPRGVKENLETVLPALEHALKKLQGDQSDCARGA